MSLFGNDSSEKTEVVNEYTKKRQEYLEYIQEHKENVKKSFKYIFAENDLFMNKHDIRLVIEEMKDGLIINSHDNSKFSDEEFEPYRRYFHSVNEEEKSLSEEDFEKAWEHHYRTNAHHYEHWINENGDCTEMDMYSIIEMICDWGAMSIKFGGTISKWYEENKDTKIQLHPNTRQIVESILYIEKIVN